MSKIDLSVVITAHDEGLIIHKTLRSVFEALDKVKETGYSYELIIHVDNGDEATIDYLGRYRDDDKIRIFENNFGDAGPSRNFAVKMAKGKYIAFLDGDDLVSPNWFLKAMKLVKSIKGDMIVHPEAILTFGVNQPNVLTIQRDSRKNKEDIKILASANMWCSVALAKKKIFEETPYGKLGDGYGHEDWVFNIETIEKGVVHRIAKDTVLFYRRSEKSRLSSSNRDGAVIPTMRMFDPGKMAEIATPELDRRLAELASNREELENDKDCIEEEVSDRGMFYKLYKMIRNNSFLDYFITPIAKATLKIMGRLPENSINQGEDNMEGESETVVPDFVIEEWVSINHIEPMLYPFKGLLSAVTLYDASTQSLVGEGYCKLAKMVKEKPDYIFIVPWVVRGGADKVLFNYIDALREKHPEWHFAVISTLPVESSWAKNLPDCVDFIDFGNIAAGMWSDQARDELMSRLIVQLGCKKIHIINSEFGYLWVERHKKLIEAEYQLDVSIFAWGYIEESNYRAVGSYANPYLFEIYPVVRYIFTDNQNMIDYLAEVNGFDRDKMKVLYQPMRDMEIVAPRDGFCEDGRIKIIWAGRVTPVKMPELVAEIGRNVDESKVSIDVYGEFDDLVEEGVFDDIPALKYRGVYDGFGSLPIHEYDLLLYTSLSDGVPNVILEATAAGLPIIASDDGGVGEFIKDGETGILVRKYKDYREYIKHIERILDKPEKLRDLASSSQKLLKKQHSWKEFVSSVVD